MLKKYNLLKDETSIDTEGVATFLDKWGEANEAFKPTIEVAKDRCLGKELPGPPQICEANKLVFCISSTLFSVSTHFKQIKSYKRLRWYIVDILNLLNSHTIFLFVSILIITNYNYSYGCTSHGVFGK